MKKEYFKVSLNNDLTEEFDVIGYYPFLSANLREVIEDRPIFEECSDELCFINSCLTYNSMQQISQEEVNKIIGKIKNNEETMNKYNKYLNSVEENSKFNFNKKFINYGEIKKRKRTRK